MGTIWFFENNVATTISNTISVQNIDSTSLTFPEQIAKFADKCYPSGIVFPGGPVSQLGRACGEIHLLRQELSFAT